MKCAIIDDDITFSKQLYQKVNTFLENLIPDLDIQMIHNNFKQNDYRDYDIVFLDIDLKEMNGIELGKSICSFKSDTLIIFVSSLNEFVFDALSIHPIFFMRKNFLDKDFQTLTTILNNELKNKFRYITLKIKGRTIHIYHHDIQYITIAGHDVTINTGYQFYTLRNTLHDMIQTIDNPHIIQVSKVSAVNLEHIIQINNQTILLEHNVKIDIGRVYKDEVMQKYEEYLLR